MKGKKYRQPMVRDALRAIREDLGPDALVLTTEMVTAYRWQAWMGMRHVRVTAALPAPPPLGRPAVTEGRWSDSPASTRSGLVARRPRGLDRGTAERVAAAATDAGCLGATIPPARCLLTAQLGALAVSEEAYSRVKVFIGTQGVGKTASIAKLAAQERARRGRALGLVGADALADEAETIGPVPAAAADRSIPVSYVTTGQRVPEDLDRATPATLAGVLVRNGEWGQASAAHWRPVTPRERFED